MLPKLYALTCSYLDVWGILLSLHLYAPNCALVHLIKLLTICSYTKLLENVFLN